jgi:hypothetical protein
MYCTCNASTLNCNKTTIRCKRIEVAKIRALYQRQDKVALKKLCQQLTLIVGRILFSMVHTEGLHALEIGVMKYMDEILMKELPTAQHGTLDDLVKKLNYCPNQHGFTGFPRCTWPDEVTSLAKLTGDQRVGKMFPILLVALTKDGQTIFKKYLPGGKNTWQCVYIVLNRCSAVGHGLNKITTGWLTTQKLVMQPPNPSESRLDSYNNSGQDKRVYNGH